MTKIRVPENRGNN